MDNPKPKGRWFQFSLRTLLLLVVLVSIGMSWLGVRLRRARKQREAVEAIGELAEIVYDYQFRDYVVFEFDDGTEVRLPTYTRNPELSVPLWLRHLLGEDFFADVRGLFFTPKATDRDLSRVPAFLHLEILGFANSGITDSGLMHLESLADLRFLDLKGTQVTAEGVKKLREALPECEIVY